MPKVSVVILSHRPAMLRQAIDSVFTQTEPDLQMVVQYCPSPWPTKLNEAVEMTVAPYVVILCDDDLLDPTYVAECLTLADKGADIVYTDRRIFQDGDEPSEGRHFRMHGDAYQGEPAYWIQQKPEDFCFGSSLPMTCMIRRAWWNRMAGYDPHMPHADTEFWFRSVLNGARTAYIPQPLFWYREHPGQSSKVADEMAGAIKAFHAKHFQMFGVIGDSAVIKPDRECTVQVVPVEHRLAYAAEHQIVYPPLSLSA